MSSIRFFNPGLAYQRERDEILPEIERVLSSGQLILRDDLEQFEESLAKYLGTKYAVGVANGTDAIYLCLLAHDVGSKDTVLCPSYTFRATPDCSLRLGAKVILYDHNERPSFDGITVWTPAHIAGEVPEWMGEAIEEAHEKGILVIEDAAQAIGAAPVRGKAATYSFYPAKILGCYGDGGAVATNDTELYDWLKRARNHFKGEAGPVGLNSRLDNLQAAVLNVKLKKLPAYIKRRKEIAETYDKALSGVVEVPNKLEVYQDYIIATDRRDELFEYLAEHGIETMKNGYPFAECLTKGPKTQEYEARSLRLPCNPELTDTEVEQIITAIQTFYA